MTYQAALRCTNLCQHFPHIQPQSCHLSRSLCLMSAEYWAALEPRYSGVNGHFPPGPTVLEAADVPEDGASTCACHPAVSWQMSRHLMLEPPGVRREAPNAISDVNEQPVPQHLHYSAYCPGTNPISFQLKDRRETTLSCPVLIIHGPGQ